MHPVQPFLILESKSLRPPIRSHPEYLQNKTWLEYTTHVNDVLTQHLGEKVILSRSLLQKRFGSSRTRAMDVSAWHNPYETLIGESIPDSEREFINDAIFLEFQVRFSKEEYKINVKVN